MGQPSSGYDSSALFCPDGIFLLEVNRVLRPGGYFVLTSPSNTVRSLRDPENQRRWTLVRNLAESLCWDMMSQQDETIVWKKTDKKICYKSRCDARKPICHRSLKIEKKPEFLLLMMDQ